MNNTIIYLSFKKTQRGEPGNLVSKVLSKSKMNNTIKSIILSFKKTQRGEPGNLVSKVLINDLYRGIITSHI
jgi:hypothetical protein